MEIYFLGADFSVLDGPIDEINSAVWSERFFELGTFRMCMPRTLYSRVSAASYVCGSGGGEVLCGRIERITADGEGDCTVSGYLLEVLLADRIMEGGVTYGGTLTEVIRSAVSDNLRGCGVEIADELYAIDSEVQLVSSYGSMSDWLHSVLRPYGASYTVRLDFASGIPVFEIVCGVERSSASTESGSRAVFSASFGNIASVSLEENTRSVKNVVYIRGADGTVVTVDKSGGGAKREIYRNASDIMPSAFASTSYYISALERRGEEVLAACPEALSVTAECDTDALPQYRVDYALGDVCDVADDSLGVSVALRLTEVDTVYENGKKAVYPTFGG